MAARDAFCALVAGVDSVKTLLRGGAPVNIGLGNIGGGTPLHFASTFGALEVVRVLVEEGGAHVDATDDDGLTALGHAYRNGRVDVVRYLGEHAKARTTSELAMTAPYTVAAIAKQTKVMRYLRDDAHVAVDPHVEEVVRVSSALAARNVGGLRKLMSEEPTAARRMRRAAWEVCVRTADVKGVGLLIKAGAGVNELCLGQDGTLTSLHHASEYGRVAIVRDLVLKASANVEARAAGIAYASMTALDIACFHGHLSVVQLLVECGKAKVQCPAQSGHTSRSALARAAAMGRLEIVMYLVKKAGAEVEGSMACVGGHDYSAVQLACLYGHVDVLRYLIKEAGASCTSVTDKIHSPLLIAIRARYVEVVEGLLQEGDYGTPEDDVLCYSCLRDQEGTSTADIRGVAIVRALVQRFGARFTNDDFCLAFLAACKDGNEGIIDILLESGGQALDAVLALTKYGRAVKLVEVLERQQLDASRKAFSEILLTSLRMACQKAQLAVIDSLVQLWSPKDFPSEYSIAFAFAAESGHLGVVRTLAAAGVDPRTAKKGDVSALALARKKVCTYYTHHGLNDEFVYLIMDYKDLDIAVHKPLLMAATKQGHIEAARFISGYIRSRVVRSGRHCIGHAPPPVTPIIMARDTGA